MRTTILTTERLALTTWLESDLADLQRLHAHPDAMAQMTTGVQDSDRTRARIHDWMQEHKLRGWSKWRIQDTVGRFVGRAGFSTAHHTGHREIGYLLAPEHWGQGYATELVTALVAWHFENPHPALHRDLLAYVHAKNTASQRVLEKCHFTTTDTPAPSSGELVYHATAAAARSSGPRSR